MKFFSDCCGDCKDCFIHYWGGCLAGHGDDDFEPMNQKRFNELMESKLPSNGELRVKDKMREKMIENFSDFAKNYKELNYEN